MKSVYKQNNNFEKRSKVSTHLKEMYPSHIPIIIEQANPKQPITIKQIKYLSKTEHTVGQFLCNLRKQLDIKSTEAVFIFCVKGKDFVLAPTNSLMGSLYQNHHDDDGMLYLWISGENAFGYSDFF
jgi:GABA(A) receptor-associated protein